MASKAPLVQPLNNSLNWDTPLNSNFGITSDALGAITSVSVTTTNVTLTATQAQRAGLSVSGTLTGNRSLFLPQNCVGSWIVYNTTSGAYTLTIYSDNGAGAPAGTGVPLTTGYAYTIFSDGTNVRCAENNTVSRNGDTMTGALVLPSNGLNVGSGQLQVTGGAVTTSGAVTSGGLFTAPSIKTDTISEKTASAGVTVSGVPIANSAISGDYLRIASKTAQNATGASISFTGIPTWARRITVMFYEVSLSGSDNILVQIGPASSLATSGYASLSWRQNSGGSLNFSNSTSGFIISVGNSTDVISCSLVIDLVDPTTYKYVSSFTAYRNSSGFSSGAGNVALSGLLNQVAIICTGTNTFDAGSINVLYE